MAHRSPAEVRRSLGHPIVDGDGHFVEVWPLAHEEIVAFVEREGGARLRDRFLAGHARPLDTTAVAGDRAGEAAARAARDRWTAKSSWWGWPCENALDRATSHLPALLYERLDEIGIDFAVLYPSMSLAFLDLQDDELAPLLCQAVNAMHAREFGRYADRLTVGALLPMNTPDGAIATLEHAVGLGLKAGVISGFARRPIAKLEREHGPLDPPVVRYDTYGLDSAHDYDPFWQRCCDLGVAPVSHSSTQQYHVARSVSSYVYNHVGGLARGHEALAKSLFLGGVTRRFPALRIGFLEGGVAWACSLLADLLGHWEKRNARAIRALDPARLDVDALMGHFERHGDAAVRASLASLRAYYAQPGARPEQLDEFEAVGIERAEDVRDRFVPSFFFGCEADDPLAGWAFAEGVNPFGARLHAMLGSDIAHWDVVDMKDPVPEAYEAVEHGRMTEADFRDFAFANAVRLHGGMNARFFEGTVVEAAAADVLAKEGA
ncbi:MAG: amidohydrolase family protein [Myxococcales bacterium]|nr:amidohydrolase family protein [Myxococcales bacterium]